MTNTALDPSGEAILHRARGDVRLIGCYLLIKTGAIIIAGLLGVESWSLSQDIDWMALLVWIGVRGVFVYAGVGLALGGPAGRIIATLVIGAKLIGAIRYLSGAGEWLVLAFWSVSASVMIWVLWSRRARPLFSPPDGGAQPYPDGELPRPHTWVRWLLLYVVVSALWGATTVLLSRLGIVDLPAYMRMP